MELSEFKRILRQVFLLPIVALLLVAALLTWQFRESIATVVLIEQADHRIALVNHVSTLMVDEETGLRGYQTTGDVRFLAPYHDSEAALQALVDELRAMTRPGPGQFVNLNRFVEQHNTWHTSFADPMVAAIAAGGRTSDVAVNLKGKAQMDTIRATLRQMIATAEQRRAERIALWHRQNRTILLALIGLTLLVGVGLGLFTRSRLHAVSSAFRTALRLQHQRTEELFQSEQHLRTTLASIGDGVITCDAHGRVQTMNIVSQELTGWSEAEALGHPIEDIFNIVNETTREPVENPVAKVKRLDRIVGLANHTILIRKDGTELNIDDSGGPIRDHAGKLTGVVMVFRDITAERKTQAALLANEKLAVAGRLAATIAHEIHNPLDSVSNLLFLLKSGSTPEESQHFLELAQSELARVTQISRAMLSLYRESKAPVPVDLKDMLDGLLLLMERRFHDLGVTVSADLPPVTVEGFPAELRQVFTNLITNAAEAASPGGTVAIRIVPTTSPSSGAEAARTQSQPGALIEITDSGPGISDDVREHLFTPFFTTKGEHGTGLGLWVSHGIIRKHGGTIRLTTTPGADHGTTASVFLATKPQIDPGGD